MSGRRSDSILLLPDNDGSNVIRIALLALVVFTFACSGARTGGTPDDTQPVQAPTTQARAMTLVKFEDLISIAVPAPNRREAYGSDSLQFGELRLPPGKRRRLPVIVLIHGGCWQSEFDFAHVAPAANALAREGFAVWTPEYRRLGDPGGGWPGTFDDVTKAVDHVRELSARFPALDTSRVILVGHSAGGQLAFWAASRKTGGAIEPAPRHTPPPLHALAVVSLAGITDLATYGAEPGGCNTAVHTLLGGTPSDVPERYRRVNPVELLPLGVRLSVVHGSDDTIVPVAQSQDFVNRATRAGDRASLTIVPGAGHFDLIAPQSAAWNAVVAAIRSTLQ